MESGRSISTTCYSLASMSAIGSFMPRPEKCYPSSRSRVLPILPAGQVVGPETRVLGDAREHLWADFFAIVKGEHDVSPTLTPEGTVRTRLPSNLPTDAKNCSKDSARFRGRPPAHAAGTTNRIG